MDRKRYQFSLDSPFVLTTACAVLMSLVKTFPKRISGNRPYVGCVLCCSSWEAPLFKRTTTFPQE